DDVPRQTAEAKPFGQHPDEANQDKNDADEDDHPGHGMHPLYIRTAGTSRPTFRRSSAKRASSAARLSDSRNLRIDDGWMVTNMFRPSAVRNTSPLTLLIVIGRPAKALSAVPPKATVSSGFMISSSRSSHHLHRSIS